MKHIPCFRTMPILCASALVLASCSNIRDDLGLTKDAPDEFTVVKHAPLAMPPGMALPPPRPGAPRPQEKTPVQQAKQTVFGTTTTSATTQSATEKLLLQQAGATATNPAIRKIVEEETNKLHDRNKPVAEKLLGIGGDKNQPSASVVDAKKEYERLKKNKEEGKPVTEGETPSIEE